MRIAIVHWSRRKVGGAETYLGGIIPELHRLGHELAFWHEIDQPTQREQIALPEGAPAWCVADLGAEQALAALRDWHPDLIYAHGLVEPELEAQTLEIAPAIFFAHAYYGACISEAKTFRSPTLTPCDRRFGWRCLLHYYPHRCGGLSPVAMLREFKRQSKRLQLLRRYRATLTFSEHMCREYSRYGLSASCVYPPVTRGGSAGYKPSPHWRLLFLGRLDFLKGGHIFLKALPQVSAYLNRPLRVTFAGDGPERKSLEREAANSQAKTKGLRTEFVGWVDNRQRELMFANCDLLVVPSLWPEPFGLVGPEAGLYGIPAAAFAVGGIPEWLIDGINGYLAPAKPPTAAGLAKAIIECLRCAESYASLRRGAKERAEQFSMERHLAALSAVFENVCS